MFEKIKKMFTTPNNNILLINEIKKETVKKNEMQVIKVKKNKNSFNCFKGKFVTIVADIGRNDKEIFYFEIFDQSKGKYIKISNNISDKYYSLCKNYKYGLIYDYDEESYTIAIICQNGYVKTFDVELLEHFNNGESFVIEENDLIDNNKVVGKIKRTSNETITMNVLEDKKLICFIGK